MNIKLTQPGWQTYTGSFGGVNFVDGAATDVDPATARRLANIVTLESEDGKNPSSSQQALDSRLIVPLADTMEMQGFGKPAAAPVAAIPTEMTREQLEAIADKEGITGLRRIAPAGVKANSIAKLIEELLAFYKGGSVERSEVAKPEGSDTAPEAPQEAPVEEVPEAAPAAPEEQTTAPE